MLGYFALTLLPVAAILYIIWAHRRREARRTAASSKRFAEMFGTVPGATPATASGAAARAASPATGILPAVAPPAALCSRKETILDARHGELYCALTAALSGFRVFPHVSLAAVVQLPATLQGREREQRLRALAQNTIDCLICGEAMEIIAAVDRDDGPTAESRIKSEYLAAAGVRYVRLNPAALPGPDDMRSRVLGCVERSAA